MAKVSNQLRIIGGEWRGRKFRFPDAPDFILPVEKVPLLDGKPIPLERVASVDNERHRNFGRLQGKMKRTSAKFFP